jgi:hypothetical protein
VEKQYCKGWMWEGVVYPPCGREVPKTHTGNYYAHGRCTHCQRQNAHGPDLLRVCAAKGDEWECLRISQHLGLCNTHYKQLCAHAKLEGIKPATVEAGSVKFRFVKAIASPGLTVQCEYEACVFGPDAGPAPFASNWDGRGYCKTHYSRARLGIDMSAPLYEKPCPRLNEDGSMRCVTCGVSKLLSEFTTSKKVRRGVTAQCKACARNKYLLSTFGIDQSEWDDLFLRQGRSCYVCGSAASAKDIWHVDHAHHDPCGHDTGKGCRNCIRGISCQRCNNGLLGSYDSLPTELRTWGDLNTIIARRPIRELDEGIAA